MPYNGYDLFEDKASAIRVYSTNIDLLPKQGVPNGLSPYGTVVIFSKAEYSFAIYTDVYSDMAICNSGDDKVWKTYSPDAIRNELNNTGILSKSCIPWKDINITSNNSGIAFFSNWTGESCFPENYGSGIIFPCIDVTNKRILYIGQSGKLYSGTLLNNDKNSITWYNP